MEGTSCLHLLLVEDSEDDAALLLRHLTRAGYDVIHKRVESEIGLRRALSQDHWDIVLSDYVLPAFSGLKAIRVVREMCAGLPVILLSGKIGEETAVAAMRAGAQDYLMKDNLARLAPAVERELVEARLRQSHNAAETALRESQELFRRIVEATDEGILTINPTGDIQFVNQRLATILGLSREHFSGLSFAQAVDQQILPRFPLDLNLMNSSAKQDFSFQTAAGQRIWLTASTSPLYEPDGRFLGNLFLYRDITSRYLMEERLRQETLRDSLTGLANITLLRDRIDQVLERLSIQPASEAALLLVDLDRFRNINETFGHNAGDQMLVEVARRLKQSTRPGDLVARHDGDQFSVLCENLSGRSAALELAATFHQRLVEPLLLEGKELVTTASIGLVPLSRDHSSAEDVLHDAYIAMHRAKSMGRGAVVSFHESLRAIVVDRLQLENDLRKAIINHELRVHYQPILHLETGKIMGVEALVRWQHPVRGLLLPQEFLPLASELSMSAEIDWWVLEHSCHQIARWRCLPAARNLSLFVNCSGERFSEPESVQRLLRTVSDSGVPTTAISLELVETQFNSEAECILRGLAELKHRGVGVIVDDFGTGYSSLERLSYLPVTGLKIAGSFFSARDEHFRIVSTILQLAHDLNLMVVAEGVETRVQAERLRRMRCDYVQGFCFAPPLVAEVAEILLAKGEIP